MEINIKPERTSVSHHVSPTDEVEVRGYPAQERPANGGYGNPSFVTLQVDMGSWAKGTRQSITLFFSPEVAARLGGELTLASAEAICPDEEGDEPTCECGGPIETEHPALGECCIPCKSRMPERGIYF